MNKNIRTTNCSQLGFMLGFLGGSVAKDHLPMQETWVRSLVWEDPKCQGTTRPKCYNYRAYAPEPGSRYPEPTCGSY